MKTRTTWRRRTTDGAIAAAWCRQRRGYAYRRDRRKDLLSQENGYFVFRFLAEDVGTHLDDVLDTILRSLAHRRRGQL